MPHQAELARSPEHHDEHGQLRCSGEGAQRAPGHTRTHAQLPATRAASPRGISDNWATACRPVAPHQRIRLAARLRGQALIVVLAFCAILGAALFSIFNTIQISADKRDLVDAADAAAYSGASVLAQGLNYTAYTNRAILANNALIGQMTAVRSTLSMSQWYWKNSETMWRMVAGLTRWIPYVGGVAAGISNAAAKFADFWGGKVVYPVQVMAEVLQTTGTAAVGMSNQAMWLSQQLHMAESLGGFEPNMIKVAKDNAPDADVDWALHGSVFGPAITVGMFASQFQPKVRKSRRTLGTAEAAKDEYLNYLTEVNRHAVTPEFLGGRNLMPNAVGLFIATGCDSPANALTSGTSGAFAPSAGLGGGFDTAARAVDSFASVLSVIVNPIMCLFQRQGGSELVQLKDGKMAWLSVDAMAFKLPVIGTRIPLAGGAVMSFTERGESQQRLPEAVRKYEELLHGNRLFKGPDEYMGNLEPKVPDCVEYLRPGNWDHYAISTNSRTSGNCAVLATGSTTDLEKKGMWAGKLRKTAQKTLSSRYQNDRTAANATGALTASLGAAAGDFQAQLEGSAGRAPQVAVASGLINPLPPGVSSGVNEATAGQINAAGLRTAGESLTSSAWMNSARNISLTGLAQRLNPAQFRIDPASIVRSAAASGPSSGGRDGGPGFWARLGLRVALGAFIDVDALIDLMRLRISDGVERPRSEATNRAFNILADGLPPYFWDVNVTDPVQSRPEGKRDDLVYTDENPKDYDPRRYNLGPIVYLPLIKKVGSTRTAAQTGRGGALMGLPDYEESRGGLRSIGKARIFFRQPADQWLTRYKRVTNASLLLPYWQVRSESLSYVDKLGLNALDGIANAAN